MSSLTACLKKAGNKISDDDVTTLKDVVSEYRGDGMSASEAAMKAVDELIDIARADRAELVGRIEAAGGVVEPKAADITSLSDDDFDALLEDVAPSPGRKTTAAPEKTAASPKKTAASTAIKAAAQHGVKGVDEALTGLTELFGGKSRLSSGLTFDEDTYAKAKPHFKKSLEEFVAAGKSLAEFVRFIVDNFGDNIKPYLKRFHQDVKAANIRIRGIHDDADSAAGQERDSQAAGDTAPLDEAAAGDDGRRTAGPGESAGEGSGESRAPEQGDRGVSGSGAATGREPSDTVVSQGKRGFEFADDAAGSADGGRPGAAGSEGVSTDGRTGRSAEETARPNRLGIVEKRKLQAAANSIPVEIGNPANIKETLPFLLDEQHDDVLKAENRFSSGGLGMMFTNGTGTGKTYTGLGIIKRHMRDTGSDDVLILAPTDPKVKDWIEDAKNLQIEATQLKNKKDKGQGVVVTTYANFRDNWELQARDFSMVVYDESHYLGQSEKQKNQAFWVHRATANHKDGMLTKAEMRDNGLKQLEYGRRKYIQDGINTEVARLIRDGEFEDNAQGRKTARKQATSDLTEQLNDQWRMRNETAYQEGAKRAREASKRLAERYPGTTKALFLSASPFAYHDSLDYAEGFVYDYGPENEETQGGWSHRDQKTDFFIANLGYRFRYGKLTKPDTDVDIGLMERRLNEQFKQTGSLSARMLEVDYDYSRDFVVFDSELGRKIDRGLNLLNGLTPDGEYKSKEEKQQLGIPVFEMIPEAIRRKHTPIYMAQLMESIKASQLADRVQQHLDLGRKVVVFHDYQEGVTRHPFDLNDLSPPRMGDDASQVMAATALREEIKLFHSTYPEFRQLPLSGMQSVVETIQARFGGRIRVINGRVSNKEKSNAKRLFNEDDSGVDVIVVQRQSGREGISLHDTSQEHQRVLIDMGLPVAPVDALQTEGRVYRYGVMSNAVIEYPVLQVGFERRTFAMKIATRARTAENLAMGNLARDMESAFKEGYINASEIEPSTEQGTGQKESDRSRREDSPWDTAKALYYGREKNKKRRDQRKGIDYFSTPEPLGLKMVEWAGIRPGERALEPSAGHGAIARWFPEDSRNVFIEPSAKLAAEVQLLSNGESRITTFEDLTPGTYFDAIVMNPPYGTGGLTAMKHLEKAMKHLRNGGRIVALIPEGPAADKRFEKLMYGEEGELDRWKDAVKSGKARQSEHDARRRILENYHIMADIGLPRVTFERAGTSVKARIVIIDRYDNPSDVPYRSGRREYGQENINEFFDAIEIANAPARGEVEQSTVEPDETKSDAEILKDNKIQIFDMNGTWVVHGKTFDHRDAMRRLGGSWNGQNKDWEFDSDPTEAVAEYLRNPGSLPEPAATGGSPEAVGTPAGPGLAPYGLKVTKTTTRNGNDVWEVTGNTMEHKAALKALGGKWWGPKKAWSFYKGDPTAPFLRDKGQMQAADDYESGGVAEDAALYSGYERDPRQVQERKGRKAASETGQLDLFAAPGLPAKPAAAQSRDNFNIGYKQVPVGEIRSAFDRITTPEEAAHLVAPIRKHAQETFLAVVVDGDGKVLNVIRHSKGVKDGSNVSPVEVAAAIGATEGAKSVWFAHNHPVGVQTPSVSDQRITNKLLVALEGSGVDIKGHLIAATSGNFALLNETGDTVSEEIKPTPGIRRQSISFTERMLRKTPPSGLETIDGPEKSISVVRSLETESGILLLNNRHHVIGVMGLSPIEMRQLRTDGRVRRILEGIDRTNAAAVVMFDKTGNAGGLNNLGNYLARLGELRVLDAIESKDGTLSSRAVVGLGMGSVDAPFFSTGQAATDKRPLSRPAVTRIIKDIRDNFTGVGVKIETVNSESELPQEIQDRAAKDGVTGLVRAVYHRGEIYLVAPMFSSRLEVEEALAHELSGHYGGRLLFDKTLKAAYTKMYFELRNSGVRRIAKENGINLDGYFKTAAELPPAERPFFIVDELLAHLQGARVYDSLPDRIKRIIQEFWGAVRDRLRALGLVKLADITDADLQFLLKRMRQAAKDGEQARKDGVPAFMVGGDVEVSARFMAGQRRASPAISVLKNRITPLKPRQGNTRVSVRQAADYLLERMRAGYPDGLDINNEQDVRTAVNIAANEARNQLQDMESGHDWYNSDIADSFWLSSYTVPRLRDDAHLRVIMTAVAAATSYRQRAHLNWAIVTRIMEVYEATGRIPDKNPENGENWGTREATGQQLRLIQHLIDTRDEQGAARWLLDEHTLTEIAEVRRDSGIYHGGNTERPLTAYRPSDLKGKMSDTFNGAHMLGPKGGPFMLNLNGFEDTTGDVWFARTVGRYFGSLVDENRIDGPENTIGGPTNQEREVMRRITRDVGRRLGMLQQDIQAVLWFFEQRLYSHLGAGNGARKFSEGARRHLAARNITPRERPEAWGHSGGQIFETEVAADGREAQAGAEEDVAGTAFSRAPQDRASDTLKRKFGLKPKRSGFLKFVDTIRNTPWGDLKRHMRDEWTQGALDRFYGIKRAEQEHAGPYSAGQSGYVATRLSTGLSSVVTATLHYGTPEWHQGILQKIPDSKGLLEILEPVQEDINDWLVWMGSRRAARLMREGRERNLTPAEIQEGLALAQGREDLFQQVADDYAEFMGRILDVAQEAGLVDPVGRRMWEHADYVPFYRMTLDEFVTGPRGKKGVSHQTAGIRMLRGGESATNDLLENIVMNVTHLLDASLKNNALRKTLRNLRDSGLYEDASMEFKRELIPMSQVKQRIKGGLAAQGWDEASIDQYISMMPRDAIEGLQKMWAMKAPADPDIVRVMIGGKAKYYRVHDSLLLRALTQINMDKPGGVLDVMRGFKRVLTAGVTASPDFMLRNFIRDAAHAWAINQDGFVLGVDSVRGVNKTLQLWRKDVDHSLTGGAIDMMFAGGSFLGGYIHGTDPAETARSVRAALRKRGFSAAMQDDFLGTVVDSAAKYWDKYREIGDAIENASREATYEASVGAGKSKAQAVFDAKDLMDYSMQGQWALFQFMGDVIPFFNARLQGLYKLKRAGAIPGWDSRGKVLMRGSMITAASLALLALNWDDDRYEELEDWDKDLYWHFWIGKQHLRIPKPFEIGVIYGTIPERMARSFGDKDDYRKSIKQLWWNFAETFNLVGWPQILAPGVELYANVDSFTKRPIEGMADEGKLKSAVYTERTSETMRLIGSAVGDTINLSPKQLEHLWRGYLGTLGMYVLGASDLVVRWAQDKPELPDWRLDDYPVLKSFVRDEPARGTRYKTELYELLRKAEKVYRTINDYRKQGLIELAAEEQAKNIGKLRARDRLRRTSMDLRELRKEIDIVYRDKRMTGAQKRERVDALMERGNVLARRAVESTHPFFNERAK